MPPQPTQFRSIRLYGGADDSRILTLPVIDRGELIALVSSTGIYVSTGRVDFTGCELFALIGTEGSLLLVSNRSGGPRPPPDGLP